MLYRNFSMFLSERSDHLNKRFQLTITIVAFIVLLTGCLGSDLAPEIQETTAPQVETDITKEEPINEPKQSFSYLDQLPDEKAKAYELFRTDKVMSHFRSFSPEEMVITYLHAASMGDEDVIYDLTYNNGKLPDRDTFIQEYRDHLDSDMLDTAIKYRYYDSIQLDERESAQEEAEEVLTVLTVTIGVHKESVAYGVRKEDGIWKLELYHMIEERK
jgi:hypothetical protein